MIQGFREMSPTQKLARVMEMTLAIRQMAMMRIRKQYGAMSEREQRLRLASLWLDRETMKRVFDWDPDKEGY